MPSAFGALGDRHRAPARRRVRRLRASVSSTRVWSACAARSSGDCRVAPARRSRASFGARSTSRRRSRPRTAARPRCRLTRNTLRACGSGPDQRQRHHALRAAAALVQHDEQAQAGGVDEPEPAEIDRQLAARPPRRITSTASSTRGTVAMSSSPTNASRPVCRVVRALHLKRHFRHEVLPYPLLGYPFPRHAHAQLSGSSPAVGSSLRVGTFADDCAHYCARCIDSRDPSLKLSVRRRPAAVELGLLAAELGDRRIAVHPLARDPMPVGAARAAARAPRA